jgi:hypothetical protein
VALGLEEADKPCVGCRDDLISGVYPLFPLFLVQDHIGLEN